MLRNNRPRRNGTVQKRWLSGLRLLPGRLTIFALSGRIEKLAIEELRKLLEGQKEWHEVVLDLKEVSLVDREVMHFLLVAKRTA